MNDVARAHATAVADYRERFTKAGSRAANIYAKASELKLDQQGIDLVYHRVEEATRQTSKGEALINEVEDILLKVGPSMKKDRSTALALRSAKSKLVQAIMYRQHEADRAVQLCYKAIISAQEDTVRRSKMSGVKIGGTQYGSITTRKDVKTTVLGKLKCENVVEPYTNEQVLKQAADIIHSQAKVPLIGTVYTVSEEQVNAKVDTPKVTDGEYRLAASLAMTVKTDGKQGNNRGITKATINYEAVDDLVLISDKSASKDGQTSQLLHSAIEDANIDTDVSARSITVPDHYTKLRTSYVGDLTAGDIMAMTAGVYSDSTTIMRQAVDLRKYEREAKLKCGRHMHEGLDEIFKAMRNLVQREGMSNVVTALKWIQLTKWVSVQNNVSNGLTQVMVHGRTGLIMVKYGNSVAANLAEAITLTSPGLTYKIIKSVLSGLNVHTMSQNGVALSEITAHIDAMPAINEIEMTMLRHVNGFVSLRWLRAYMLDKLDVSLEITSAIDETSSYRAAHKLKNQDTYVSKVTTRMRNVPFDCTVGELLVKSKIEDGPLIRAAKYGRRNLFDTEAAKGVMTTPLRKILVAVTELPNRGICSIPTVGITFLGLKPQTKPTRQRKDEGYGGGGGRGHTSNDDYRDGPNTVGCGDEEGGNYVDWPSDLFEHEND